MQEKGSIGLLSGMHDGMAIIALPPALPQRGKLSTAAGREAALPVRLERNPIQWQARAGRTESKKSWLKEGGPGD